MNYQACVALVLPIWHVLDDTRLPCQPAATCHGQPKQYEVLKPPKRSEIMWISRWISVRRKVWWLEKRQQNLNHTLRKKKWNNTYFPSLWFSWIYLLPSCRGAVFSTNPRHLSLQPKLKKCIKIIQNQNSWNSDNPESSVEDPVRTLTLCTLPRTICFTRKYTQTSYVGTLIVKHFDHTSIERKVALDRKPSQSSWKNWSDKSTYSYHQPNKIIDL